MLICSKSIRGDWYIKNIKTNYDHISYTYQAKYVHTHTHTHTHTKTHTHTHIYTHTHKQINKPRKQGQLCLKKHIWNNE